MHLFSLSLHLSSPLNYRLTAAAIDTAFVYGVYVYAVYVCVSFIHIYLVLVYGMYTDLQLRAWGSEGEKALGAVSGRFPSNYRYIIS